MEKNIPAKNNNLRKPALEIFRKFLKDNNMTFVLRRQKVLFLKDNGILIEPPIVIPMYEDEFEVYQQDQKLKQKSNLTLKN